MATISKTHQIPWKWYHQMFCLWWPWRVSTRYWIFCLSWSGPFPRGLGMSRWARFMIMLGWNWMPTWNWFADYCSTTPHSKHSNLGYETGFTGFGLHAVWGHSWLIPNRWPAVKKMRRCVWIVKSDRSNISQNLKYFSKSHDLANMKVVRCGFCRALMTRKHLDYWEENHHIRATSTFGQKMIIVKSLNHSKTNHHFRAKLVCEMFIRFSNNLYTSLYFRSNSFHPWLRWSLTIYIPKTLQRLHV